MKRDANRGLFILRVGAGQVLALEMVVVVILIASLLCLASPGQGVGRWQDGSSPPQV